MIFLTIPKFVEDGSVGIRTDEEKGLGENHKVIFYKETALFFSSVSKHSN